MSEMETRKVKIGILQNNEAFCAFVKTSSTSVEILPIVERVGVAMPANMLASPVGLLLGVSLWAYHQEHPVEVKEEEDRVRTSTDSVRTVKPEGPTKKDEGKGGVEKSESKKKRAKRGGTQEGPTKGHKEAKVSSNHG
jgi:hypothetical protein